MSEQKNHYKKLGKGIACILIAWLFFVSANALSRSTVQESSLGVVVFFQNFVGFLCLIPWLFKHGWKSLYTKKIGLILVRTCMGVFGFTFMFIAVQSIPLVDATLLSNAAPIFVPFVVWIWLRRKIDHKLWIGIILGFLGIGLILKPDKAIINVGALFALGTAVTLSVSMITQRVLNPTEKGHTVLFYYFLFGTLLFLPVAILYWKTPTLDILIKLIGIGLFTTIGLLIFFQAFHYAKASHLGPFGYFSVIFAGAYDWFIWKHAPDLYDLIGILLVCSGGILTIFLSKPPPQDPLIKG